MKKIISIVGQKFKGIDPYLPGINAGTEVVLVREPANQYDKNAIAVYIGGKAVGYLPKTDNEPIARKIDARGDHVAAFGIAVDQDVNAMRAVLVRSRNSAYPQVEVEID